MRAPRIVAVLLLAAACGGRETDDTVERLRVEIAEYTREPSEVHAADVDAGFARLDLEIATLRAQAVRQTGDERTETAARVAALETTRDQLRGEYGTRQLGQAADAARRAMQSMGEAIGRGLQEAGRQLESALGATGAQDGTAQ